MNHVVWITQRSSFGLAFCAAIPISILGQNFGVRVI